ncbi:hypothetical protein F4775DRAFT_96251 [Biscogniauxia sp. FL1348]|nr:hypothetical protein F4775DRAFT_96251 [Biscogniauxia sp. FL1348]
MWWLFRICSRRAGKNRRKAKNPVPDSSSTGSTNNDLKASPVLVSLDPDDDIPPLCLEGTHPASLDVVLDGACKLIPHLYPELATEVSSPASSLSSSPASPFLRPTSKASSHSAPSSSSSTPAPSTSASASSTASRPPRPSPRSVLESIATTPCTGRTFLERIQQYYDVVSIIGPNYTKCSNPGCDFCKNRRRNRRRAHRAAAASHSSANNSNTNSTSTLVTNASVDSKTALITGSSNGYGTVAPSSSAPTKPRSRRSRPRLSLLAPLRLLNPFVFFRLLTRRSRAKSASPTPASSTAANSNPTPSSLPPPAAPLTLNEDLRQRMRTLCKRHGVPIESVILVLAARTLGTYYATLRHRAEEEPEEEDYDEDYDDVEFEISGLQKIDEWSDASSSDSSRTHSGHKGKGKEGEKKKKKSSHGHKPQNKTRLNQIAACGVEGCGCFDFDFDFAVDIRVIAAAEAAAAAKGGGGGGGGSRHNKKNKHKHSGNRRVNVDDGLGGDGYAYILNEDGDKKSAADDEGYHSTMSDATSKATTPSHSRPSSSDKTLMPPPLPPRPRSSRAASPSGSASEPAAPPLPPRPTQPPLEAEAEAKPPLPPRHRSTQSTPTPEITVTSISTSAPVPPPPRSSYIYCYCTHSLSSHHDPSGGDATSRRGLEQLLRRYCNWECAPYYLLRHADAVGRRKAITKQIRRCRREGCACPDYDRFDEDEDEDDGSSGGEDSTATAAAGEKGSGTGDHHSDSGSGSGSGSRISSVRSSYESHNGSRNSHHDQGGEKKDIKGKGKEIALSPTTEKEAEKEKETKSILEQQQQHHHKFKGKKEVRFDSTAKRSSDDDDDGHEKSEAHDIGTQTDEDINTGVSSSSPATGASDAKPEAALAPAPAPAGAQPPVSEKPAHDEPGGDSSPKPPRVRDRLKERIGRDKARRKGREPTPSTSSTSLALGLTAGHKCRCGHDSRAHRPEGDRGGDWDLSWILVENSYLGLKPALNNSTSA